MKNCIDFIIINLIINFSVLMFLFILVVAVKL